MRTHPLETVRAQIADFKRVFAIPGFAIYQVGNLVMTIGFWMQRIGVGWVTWQLTQSEAWLGAVAFAELFPSIFTAIWGGVLADKHAAPRIMFWGQIATATVSVALACLYFMDTLSAPVIVLLMAILGAVSGVLLPARLAMARHLSPPDLLPSALAVNSTGFNLSRFIGPALAALLLVVGSAGLVFAVAAAGFLSLAVALHRIRHVPSQQEATNDLPAAGTWDVLKGLLETPLILGVMLLQLIQGLLIRPASELFPAYSEVAFDRGEVGLGLLNAALGIGAIVGALLLTRSREKDAALRQILEMSGIFAATLLCFAITQSFWLALIILVIHGATMSASNIAALTYVQLQAPPNRLGRILSLYTIIFRVGPAVGAFCFGAAAEATGLMTTGVLFALAGLATTGALWVLILGKNKLKLR